MNINPTKQVIRIGYAHVDKDDKQDLSLENQIELLEKESCIFIYSEKTSEGNEVRSELLKALRHVQHLAEKRTNEIYLIVVKNDCISIKIRTVINMIDDLSELGIHYISLEDHIDTSTTGDRMIFQILSSFNNYEVVNNSEKLKILLEKAKKYGKKLGRPKIPPEVQSEVLHLYQSNNYSVKMIAEKYNISTKSIYNIIKQFGIPHRRGNYH